MTRRLCAGLVGVALLGAGVLAGCGGGAPPEADAAATSAATGWTDAQVALLASMHVAARPVPPSPTNPVADDPEAVALGRTLFFDGGLSPSGAVSCATCHDPALHFSDGLPKGRGLGTTGRHTPVIEGSQFGPWFFWDGRADSLWAQAAGPMEHPDEMGSSRTFVARRVASVYAEAYAAVFGPAPDLSDPTRFPDIARPEPDRPSTPHARAWEAMDPGDREAVERVFVNALRAIAAYERTLLPAPAPFDRYAAAIAAGDPEGGGHLSDAAERGLRLFIGRGQCASCHHGPMFTDRAFHALGLPAVGPVDLGRTVGARAVLASPWRCGGPHAPDTDCPELRYLDPSFQDFQGAFKTPTLRNVARTAPYMHDGSFATLRDVLAFYSLLPGSPPLGHRELTLAPLNLTPGETDDLLAFLEALSSDRAAQSGDASRSATPRR